MNAKVKNIKKSNKLYITIFFILLSQITMQAGCKKSRPEILEVPSCMDRADFGDPEESDYILPYKVGDSYLCGQSICFQGGGHRNQLSYDFMMKIGDEVCAARSGVVRETKDDSPDDGQGEGRHNYILIEHENGTVAFYAHLQQEGLLVQVGDWVETGQIIAYSGNSGLTGSPHLHFGVYQYFPPHEGDDVSVNFRNCEGPLSEIGALIMGMEYLALPYDTKPAAYCR